MKREREEQGSINRKSEVDGSLMNTADDEPTRRKVYMTQECVRKEEGGGEVYDV